MHERRWLLIAATCYVALFAVLLHVHAKDAPFALYTSALVLFAGLMLLLRRTTASSRYLTVVVIAIAVALQVVAWTAGPNSSDDVYRYVWDGRVQFAGIDPYAHAPSSPALAGLRDHVLFPGGHCPHPFAGGCTLINRPDVHTVYPPAAQLTFDLARLVSAGGHGGPRPFQVLASLGVLAITVLLLRGRRGRAVWPVALWAWSPLAVLEYGNNAHIDWSAVLVSLLALSAARRGRTALSGSLIAVAVLIKLYPALLVPSLLRRHPVRLVAAAIVTGAVLYLPHVIAQGAGVVGFLPGYLQQEGYGSGSRLLLLGSVLPHPADTVVGVLILAGVAWWAFRRADPDAPERTAVVLVGATFLVTTPTYGWYAGLLLALCVAAERYEWIPVALVPTLIYLLQDEFHVGPGARAVTYLVAGLGTAAASAGLRFRRREPRPKVDVRP